MFAKMNRDVDWLRNLMIYLILLFSNFPKGGEFIKC